jgi:hypothetical protein
MGEGLQPAAMRRPNMLEKKLALTAGAIAAVMAIALITAVQRVSSYEDKAAAPAGRVAGDARVVEVKLPATAVDDPSQARLLERCRKEAQTTEGRELARAMGDDEEIIALCLETAQVLSD